MGDFYEKYTAFECAYYKANNTERINENNVVSESKNRVFETRHLEYSHDPEKLKKVDNGFFYLYWFDNLLLVSQKSVKTLTDISTLVDSTKTTWLGLPRKGKEIDELFERLYKINEDIDDFKIECFEFQMCFMASSIDRSDLAETLQEQIRYIDSLETRVVQSGDRKLANINNSRMQFFGLVLSIVAIVVSTYSVINS